MDSEEASDSTPYSAEDQKRILRGLRVLVRVAVRTYLQQQGFRSQPQAPTPRGEDET